MGICYFKTNDNLYIASNPNGEVMLVNEMDIWGQWRIFSKVYILGSNNLYLCGEKNNGIIANRRKANHWEIWLINILGEDKIFLKSFWGNYIGLNNNQVVPKKKSR